VDQNLRPVSGEVAEAGARSGDVSPLLPKADGMSMLGLARLLSTRRVGGDPQSQVGLYTPLYICFVLNVWFIISRSHNDHENIWSVFNHT
jgi:hypothetical protein